ncbi:MAG: hypothetical protein GY714_04165 [Desulfobacterales bacterium]|nr:hypothetical protein [Desulfobacterales bacterium]
MDDLKYKKLAKKRFFLGYSSLWESSDHLLLAKCRGFTEEYKRFYFNDIQAISTIKTKSLLGWNIFFSIMLIICFFTMINNGTISVFFFFLFAILILIHSLKGKTCKTYITTAVQKTELFPLTRRNISAKTVNKIQELVNRNQGIIDEDEIDNPDKQDISVRKIKKVSNVVHTKYPKILFGLMLIYGFFEALIYWKYYYILSSTIVMILLLSLILVAAIVSLAKSKANIIPLKVAMISSIVFSISHFIAMYIGLIVELTKLKLKFQNTGNLILMVHDSNPLKYTGFYVGIVAFIIGLIGIYFTFEQGKKISADDN